MNTLRIVFGLFTSLIEKYPSLGYVGGGVSTGAGFWVLVERATKIGALASVIIGIAVGLVTWRVQRLQERKLKGEPGGGSSGSGGSKST
jgi:Na+/proline symporter